MRFLFLYFQLSGILEILFKINIVLISDEE